MASGCSSQPDWDTDNEQYCVDGDGDMLPMSACNGNRVVTSDDSDGGGAFVMMYGSHYRSKYPSKYKSYSSKMRSSGYYKPSARTSSVSRGSAGSTGRSYGGSFGG